MGIGLQMLEVAIGWQVYALHRSALDLGWIGLAEFVPLFVLALPAGHLADRLPRRLVFGAALVLGAGVGGRDWPRSAPRARPRWCRTWAWRSGSGVVTALGTPAARAMAPTLVPAAMLPNAMTLRTSPRRPAQVLGPALGGVLYAGSPVLVYLLAAGMCLIAAGCVVTVRAQAPGAAGPAVASSAAASPEPPGLERVLEGLRFVRRTPILLGRHPAGPARRAVRRGGRAAAGVRPLDPARRPGGAGRAAGRSGGRGAGRRAGAHPLADRPPGRAHAAHRRGGLRHRDHRVRAVPDLPALRWSPWPSAGSPTCST